MAEGTIAKGIVQTLRNHEIFFFSVHDFKYRFSEFVDLTKRVDVVHWLFNVGHLDEKYTSFFKNLEVPNIATVHHVDHDEIYKINQASLTNLVHVVSNEWLLYLKKRTKTPVILAPLGLFIDKFKTVSANLYEGFGTFKIGIMGFYPGKNNRKRLDIAIAVFEELLSKRVDIEIVVQGSGWENYYDEFNRIGLKYNHRSFTSDGNNLKFFENIHVYMCTSDIEGGPLPVLEAMASGVPVISTKVGMALDLLEEGGGLLCEKGNVKELVQAIIRIKTDDSLYNELAIKTKIIAKEFNWENIENQYITLYSKCIKTWEKTNSLTWEFRSNFILEANEQRSVEIAYSNIHQVRSLFKNNNLIDALKLLVRLLLNKKIVFFRKRKLLKESIRFLITNK